MTDKEWQMYTTCIPVQCTCTMYMYMYVQTQIEKVGEACTCIGTYLYIHCIHTRTCFHACM